MQNELTIKETEVDTSTCNNFFLNERCTGVCRDIKTEKKTTTQKQDWALFSLYF